MIIMERLIDQKKKSSEIRLTSRVKKRPVDMYLMEHGINSNLPPPPKFILLPLFKLLKCWSMYACLIVTQ